MGMLQGNIVYEVQLHCLGIFQHTEHSVPMGS